ncbi:MAG: uroporphyrinogen decarboxylase family protein [Nitrososphaeraceae archaeon]
MNPYERVLNRLKGNPIDKIPNLNIIMTFAANYINVPYKKYVTDYNTLVEGNISCCEKFGIDMVSAISDPCRELFDFGAEVVFPEDDVPFCKDYLIKDYSDIKKIKIKDPLKSKRMFDRIRAVSLFNAKVKGYYPILGWVEGALAEVADLRGVNELMLDFTDNPEFVIELLELCTEQEIKFALEQIKAGADFIGIGDAVASLIGPKNYCKFALPYEKRIIDEIHKSGTKVKLHICGDISKILDYVFDTGADIIDIDWMVDFNTAVKKFEGKSAACGNFNPVSILLEGNEKVVENAVISCINAGNNTTFIAAGCEVPRNTSIENMLTVDKVLKKY